MDYRTFESRLLDTILRPTFKLKPRYHCVSPQAFGAEALICCGKPQSPDFFNIESDDEGNILYTYPNRVRLGARMPGARGRRGFGDSARPAAGTWLLRALFGEAAALPAASSYRRSSKLLRRS